MSRLTVYCKGRSPLLMNRMSEAELLGLRRTGVKKSKSASKPEKPRDEAAPKVYLTRDGQAYVPTENFFSCLVQTGTMVRLDGKRQVSTAKGTILPSFLELTDEYLLLQNPDDPHASPEWEVDIRQGRNPNGGEAVCLVRPRFDRWAITVHAEIDLDEVAEAIVRDLFEKAGRKVGLGDFRPSRRGPFGRFVIDRWEMDRGVLAAE